MLFAVSKLGLQDVAGSADVQARRQHVVVLRADPPYAMHPRPRLDRADQAPDPRPARRGVSGPVPQVPHKGFRAEAREGRGQRDGSLIARAVEPRLGVHPHDRARVRQLGPGERWATRGAVPGASGVAIPGAFPPGPRFAHTGADRAGSTPEYASVLFRRLPVLGDAVIEPVCQRRR